MIKNYLNGINKRNISLSNISLSFQFHTHANTVLLYRYSEISLNILNSNENWESLISCYSRIPTWYFQQKLHTMLSTMKLVFSLYYWIKFKRITWLSSVNTNNNELHSSASGHCWLLLLLLLLWTIVFNVSDLDRE